MAEGLNPRDWRDIQILRAQGVLAEVLTVDVGEADRGLRTYAAMTGTALHEVAQQVIYGELSLTRELCVTEELSRLPGRRVLGRDRAEGC
ncbi:ANTAR domain-containing protein [Actinomycetospora endophytica]|uniref:ANTAR domain-containing protein n=1 Tax=Actinomycetospora endophytica TaxID=2291215 RepID=A0ABS8PDA7_9PSEU|nr:ANTAR domain-containing protein [Actinomycetospora endophytica]MCD2196259.1 ANTAR domain-containing protein [Actinomycetospora endophytica]